MVSKAVESNGIALAFASERLKDHFDIAMTSLSKTADSFLYFSDRLKGNRELAYKALGHEGRFITFCSKEI